MGHEHNVQDKDARFLINSITRAIKNETPRKVTLMQYDHNSERFTFECPRYIEGHDMSECNNVRVHFNNIETESKNYSKDAYTVDDLRIDPEDENKVIFTWLISRSATQVERYTIFGVSVKYYILVLATHARLNIVIHITTPNPLIKL